MSPELLNIGEKPPIYKSLRRCVIQEKSLYWNMLQNRCRRRWWFWRSNSSMHRVYTPSCWVRFQNLCNDSRTRFQDKLQSVQFFKLKSFRILASTELKFKVHPRQRQISNSWVVICRRKNRYVDELHLNDPDHHPTISKLRLERFIAKESELCSAEMEQSHIGETHATQFEIPTNLVYNCSEEYSNWTKDVEWHFILACQQFRGNTFEADVLKLVMRLVRRYDQHERETGSAVHWKSMGPKLRRAFRKAGGQKFSDSDWLQHIYKGSNKTRFQHCKKNPHIYLIVHSCSSRTHWWELDSAWVDGTRRYSIQMERILVSSRILLWCHINPQIRTHRWRTRKQRRNTDHVVHTSQPVRGQSRRWIWCQGTSWAQGKLFRKIRVIRLHWGIKSLIRVVFHPAARNWRESLTQSQHCILKRGNKMTLYLPAPRNWCGVVNFQAQPAPRTWSEVMISK